nr:MAG TPA: holin [Caudoviricetes sp.]
MLIIVIGLALADFATGWIKAYCKGDVRSSKMRKGGLITALSRNTMTRVFTR